MLDAKECSLYQEFVEKYQLYLYGLLGNYLARTHIHTGAHILDLGTGPGNLSREMLQRTDARVTALDVNPVMLDLARASLATFLGDRCSLRLGDVHRLPFASGTFDLVVSYSCFHHWDDKVRALQECQRILAPGGSLLIFDTIRLPGGRAPESLAQMISEPELYRFVAEAFEESLDMDVVRRIADEAGLSNFTVSPYDFSEEDLMACLDQLPESLPYAAESRSSPTLWLLEGQPGTIAQVRSCAD